MVTSASTSVNETGVRLAVTTTGVSSMAGAATGPRETLPIKAATAAGTPNTGARVQRDCMTKTSLHALTAFPDSAWATDPAPGVQGHRVGRYPGWWMQPSPPSQAPSGGRPVATGAKAGPRKATRPLTVAGTALVRTRPQAGSPPSFPFNCGTRTMPRAPTCNDCSAKACANPTIRGS